MMLFQVFFMGLAAQLATALVQDVPALNGPVPYVPSTEGAKRTPSDFVHPGLWHSHKDLETMRDGVLNGINPWKSAHDIFANDSYSLSSYTMKGPFPIISRGQVSNYTSFASDARAAYQNAIMWYITKDDAHYDKSTSILDAWGTTLTNIVGTDRSLMIGLDGGLFVNAAEIMRWEGGWVEAQSKWQGGVGFSVQLYWLFARQSIIIGQANYGIISIKALLEMAVYLEDVALYNYALWAYKNDPCAGIESTISTKTGQNGESGRDQAHAALSLGALGLASRTVGNQGFDLFSYGDNLLLKGAEYTAKYNLNETVPYDPDFRRCEAVLVAGPWKEISIQNRGIGVYGTLTQPIWDLLYYGATARGLQTPWTAKAKAAFDAAGGEVRVTWNDMPSWGDLLFATGKPGNGTFTKREVGRGR
ncbi:chondroitin AC/alginate lyase [Pseudomassariella vexata]|uniref:Chondroitin AC/alginate lyase n=1 Tax=Pseudomassariella vexata TaxID=1141098 RepID=A0A1Y2E3C2_9PEZI|nr:chondroitin AC/alginate lyase [Pseudomassariella vexata]ORY66050.1 chondroitin AC/alginate lyase [Pseudomassariella vexata]